MSHIPMLCFVCVLLSFGHSHGVLVTTEYGQVRGHSVPVDNGRIQTTVDVFYGIPYGDDTSGENRFMRPKPPKPWDDVLEADTQGAYCPLLSIFGDAPISEDCLKLNIYSPNVTNTGQYPVMFFTYGGGWIGASNEVYPGHFLASNDVVVVTLTYRGTILGFATTQNEVVPGNAGVWDHFQALTFVKNNIANFGGDPNSVTVFGQSAGACVTGLLMLSPLTKDLFHRAIMESGTETFSLVYPPAEINPVDQFRQVAADLNCNETADIDMVECLRQKPWEDFFNHSQEATLGYLAVYDGFMPDGSSIIPASPREMRRAGDIMKGPILTGHNHDDASLFLPTVIPEALFGCCNRTYYLYVMESRLVDMFSEPDDNVTHEKVFRGMDYNYSPWPHIYDNYQNRNSFIKLLTDLLYTIPLDELANHHQTLAPTYLYNYNYRSRNLTEQWPEWMGVPHAAELSYVWGTTMLSFNEAVRNDSGLSVGSVYYTEEDIQHTIYIQEMFTNFAKYGNPTPYPVPDPVGGTTTWPQYTFDDMNILFISNTSIETQKGNGPRDIAFWQEYVPYLSTNQPRFQNQMMMHQDYMRFVFELNGLVVPDMIADEDTMWWSNTEYYDYE